MGPGCTPKAQGSGEGGKKEEVRERGKVKSERGLRKRGENKEERLLGRRSDTGWTLLYTYDVFGCRFMKKITFRGNEEPNGQTGGTRRAPETNSRSTAKTETQMVKKEKKKKKTAGEKT